MSKVRMFDFPRFARDHGLDPQESGHKHCRAGWINISCPLCVGNPGLHLGWNARNDFFHCWRCGKHSHVEIIRGLLGVDTKTAGQIYWRYQTDMVHRRKRRTKEVDRPTELELPYGTGPLRAVHRRYLRLRKYKPRALTKEWNLMATGNLGEYKFRIIAPVYFNGKLVSYQGRDITNRSPLRYKACARMDEVRPHKACLYGLDKIEHRHTVIVVEGITDVWRMGAGAVATFGIEWTLAQLRLLSQFQRAFIMYDQNEDQARKQSDRLTRALCGLGVLTETITFDWDDPATIPQRQADEIMQELLVQ